MLVPDENAGTPTRANVLLITRKENYIATSRKKNCLKLHTSKKIAESSHYHSEMRDSMKVIARKLLACVSPLGQTLTSTE